jgi:protoporphyrinogen oxidase
VGTWNCGSQSNYLSAEPPALDVANGRPEVLIMGAGPAGLTAAYELGKARVRAVVFEKDVVVGGLARTVNYKGYLFDLGGHRFFTKVQLIERMWREVLGNDLLLRPRLSRIYFDLKFFKYPLEPLDVIANLGAVELVACLLSYFRARVFPHLPEDDMATWITNRFGDRLYRTFFKTYTEKVWGMPCDHIKADWAAQRIRGLSLWSAIRNCFRSQPPIENTQIRTLSKEFLYPRRGPGMMWSRVHELVEAMGGEVHLSSGVDKVLWEPGRVRALVTGSRVHAGSHFISTLPIRTLIASLDPPPEPEVLAAGDYFQYRDFITVLLIVKGTNLFPDNWVYVHDPRVKLGRIQNYSNWSPEMTPDANVTSLGLEYFCFEGDALWSMTDEQLIEFSCRELAAIGLVKQLEVVDASVARVPKAYPVYNSTYRMGLTTVRNFLKVVPNLQIVGRNGQHHYNNQDHSMLAGMLAARNVLGGKFDIWNLNTDQSFHEEGITITDEELQQMEAIQPAVPGLIT